MLGLISLYHYIIIHNIHFYVTINIKLHINVRIRGNPQRRSQ